jgi:site-specific DNA-methyltransferase (adenine-specific)
MSRFILGDCVQVMSRFPARAVDFILTDPPYLVGYKDRNGRTLAGDNSAEWLQPACHEMYRVLKNDSLMVSFYAWNRADLFLNAWKSAGFRVVGHIVFAKSYASKSTFVGYTHESAYLLAKGRPQTPDRPIPDVIPWKYTGNRHHPTEKPVQSLRPLIESLTRPGAIVLTRSPAAAPPAWPPPKPADAISGSRCLRSTTPLAFAVWHRLSGREGCRRPMTARFTLTIRRQHELPGT